MPDERVLIWLKPQFLGDAVMATPLLDAAIALGFRPTVMANPGVLSLFEDRNSRFDPLEARKISGVGPVLREAQRLRGLRVGLALMVNRSFRSALAARLARIPVRIGHGTEGRGFLLSKSLPYDPVQPEWQSYLDLARAVWSTVPEVPPSLSVSDRERSEGSTRLGVPAIGLQPGARYVEKQLPLPVLAEVGRTLHRDGHRLALIGGPDEVEAAQRFEALLPEVPFVNLVGRCRLRETLGVLANLSAMVGSDTGVMHLAAAVGCPTVTVFGPNPASKWGHHRPPHAVLEAPGGQMTRVTAEMVLQALKRPQVGPPATWPSPD